MSEQNNNETNTENPDIEDISRAFVVSINPEKEDVLGLSIGDNLSLITLVEKAVTKKLQEFEANNELYLSESTGKVYITQEQLESMKDVAYGTIFRQGIQGIEREDLFKGFDKTFANKNFIELEAKDPRDLDPYGFKDLLRGLLRNSPNNDKKPKSGPNDAREASITEGFDSGLPNKAPTSDRDSGIKV